MFIDKFREKPLLWQISHERQADQIHDPKLSERHLACEHQKRTEVREGVKPRQSDGERCADDKAVPNDRHEAGQEPLLMYCPFCRTKLCTGRL